MDRLIRAHLRKNFFDRMVGHDFCARCVAGLPVSRREDRDGAIYFRDHNAVQPVDATAIDDALADDHAPQSSCAGAK